MKCADCGMQLRSAREYHPKAACELKRLGYSKVMITRALKALGKHPRDWTGKVEAEGVC